MAKVTVASKSKLFQNLAAHPYLSLAAFFFFSVGIASGIAANSGMVREDFLTFAAQWLQDEKGYGVMNGFLRTALFQLLLFSIVCSAAFFRPLFLFSCLALATKGFFAGFAVEQLFFEYGGMGAVYALPLVILPLVFTGTALALAFLWTGEAVFPSRANQAEAAFLKEDKDRTRRRTLLRNLLLLGMGIVAEGILIPYLFRLLAGVMAI